MKRTDLLLKIIVAAEGEPVTPTQLQKTAFLVGKSFEGCLPSNYYQFRKYDYGPFCVKIYRDAEQLERDGMIRIVYNRRGGWKEYKATQRGLQQDFASVPTAIASFIEETMLWARSLSFQQLVRAVYTRFPAYRENSVFQG